MRFKRAISADLNLETISTSLWEMQEAAANIRWWYAKGDETMLDELIGDEEESYELKMAFSMLESDCEQMIEDLRSEWIPDCFDSFFGSITPGRLIGYDSFEGDYCGLEDGYESELAQQETRERLRRYTKDQLIESFRTCFRLALNYINLRNRYDNLKAYLDILNGENTGFLAVVKRIEELYGKISAEGYYSHKWADEEEFDKLVDSMPPEVWVQ